MCGAPREGSTEQGTNFADRSINGIKVEYASISGPSVGSALRKKAKNRQARYLIIDCREAGLTYDHVMADIEKPKARGAQKELVSIRLIGRTFDVTLFP